MDKRVEANARTQRLIIKSLVRLMNEKKFSDITVTDIVTRAGVARASYYRNFSSKEEVIARAGAIIIEDFRQKASEAEMSILDAEIVLRMFRYFRAYRRTMLTLYKAGFISMYQRLFEECLESMAGDMRYDDIYRYAIPFYSGSVFAVFLRWLEEGMKETPEEMAGLYHTMIMGSIKALFAKEDPALDLPMGA